MSKANESLSEQYWGHYQRLPVVLSPAEVFAITQQTTGVYRMMLQILYGSGLRLRECMQPRVKDIDLAQSQVIIRSGKGCKDRVTLLPQSIISPLQIHLQQVRQIHQQDLSLGYGNFLTKTLGAIAATLVDIIAAESLR